MFIMPTEYPAYREADSGGSNPGVEAPWNELASRSASEPETVSLNPVKLPDKPKPETRREEIFKNSGGILRGRRGQRVGKVGMGGLGTGAQRRLTAADSPQGERSESTPYHRLREERDKASVESIRRVLVTGESERPVVVKSRAKRVKSKHMGNNQTSPTVCIGG